MLIRFTRDYRGKLTNENFHVAGTEIDIDDGLAAGIIAEGAAVAVELPTEDTPAENAPQPVKRKRRKSAQE